MLVYGCGCIPGVLPEMELRDLGACPLYLGLQRGTGFWLGAMSSDPRFLLPRARDPGLGEAFPQEWSCTMKTRGARTLMESIDTLVCLHSGRHEEFFLRQGWIVALIVGVLCRAGCAKAPVFCVYH